MLLFSNFLIIFFLGGGYCTYINDQTCVAYPANIGLTWHNFCGGSAYDMWVLLVTDWWMLLFGWMTHNYFLRGGSSQSRVEAWLVNDLSSFCWRSGWESHWRTTLHFMVKPNSSCKESLHQSISSDFHQLLTVVSAMADQVPDQAPWDLRWWKNMFFGTMNTHSLNLAKSPTRHGTSNAVACLICLMMCVMCLYMSIIVYISYIIWYIWYI